jgi:hypothetical protein
MYDNPELVAVEIFEDEFVAVGKASPVPFPEVAGVEAPDGVRRGDEAGGNQVWSDRFTCSRDIARFDAPRSTFAPTM